RPGLHRRDDVLRDAGGGGGLRRRRVPARHRADLARRLAAPPEPLEPDGNLTKGGHVNVLLAALAAAVAAAPVHELRQSPNWRDGKFGPLVPGATYAASQVSPRPTIRPGEPGWAGTQIVTRQSGKVRYAFAVSGHTVVLAVRSL